MAKHMTFDVDMITNHSTDVADMLRKDELTCLRRHLVCQLQADWKVVNIFQIIRQSCKPLLLMSRGHSQYEYNNAMSRFYISGRNALAHIDFTADTLINVREKLQEAYHKMQQELMEKDLGSIPALHELLPASALTREVPKFAELHDDLVETPANGAFIYHLRDLTDVHMSVPSRLHGAMSGQILHFLRQTSGMGLTGNHSIEFVVRQIFLSTVRNYIMASSSLYWGLGPGLYKKCELMGGILECYASPFNHSLQTFCSPCAPLDLIFGSLGSFYDELAWKYVCGIASLQSSALIVANPPYVESEIHLCVVRLTRMLLETRKGKCHLLTLSLLPAWFTSEGIIDFTRLVEHGNGKLRHLAKNCHEYFDYQEQCAIRARFASLGIVLTNHPLDESVAHTLSIIDAMMVDDGLKRPGVNHNERYTLHISSLHLLDEYKQR